MNQLFNLKSQTLVYFLAIALFVGIGYLVGTERYLWAGAVIGLLVLTFVFIKLLENPFLGILGITFFLPFERLPTFEIGGNTVKISYILAVMTLFAWLIKSLAEGKFRLKIGTAPILGVIFLLLCLLSIFNSPNPGRSLVVLAVLVLMVFTFILFINLVDSKEKLRQVINTLIFSTIIVLAYGFYQYLGDLAGLPSTITGISERYSYLYFGFPRFQSVALEPLYFANFLLLPIGVVIGLVAGNLGSRKEKSLYFTVLFFAILALFLTVSRGAYLGFLGMLIAFIVIRFRGILTRRMVNIILKSSLTLILGAILFFQLTSLGSKAFLEIKQHLTLYSQRGSITERLDSFNRAVDEWGNHPIIGNGVGSFGPLVAPVPYEMPAGGWMIVNNEYLEILTEVGLAGLIVFILFLGTIFRQAMRAYRSAVDRYLKFIIIGSVLALVGILIQYNLFSTLYIIHFWVLLAIVLISVDLIFEDLKLSKAGES